MPEQTTSNMPAPTLRSAGVLLKDAWQLYASRAVTLIGIVVAPSLAGAAAVGLGVVALWSHTGSSALLDKLASGNAVAVGTLVAAMIMLALIYLWGYSSLLIAVTDSDGQLGIRGAYRKGFRFIGSFAWVSLLSGLSVAVGFMLFVIPAIIVGVWVSLSAIVLVVEGARGSAALKQSREYVRGRWWAVFGRLSALYLILFLVTMAAGILSEASPIGSIVELVVNVLIVSFVPTYLYMIYQDLKAVSTPVPTLADERSQNSQ